MIRGGVVECVIYYRRLERGIELIDLWSTWSTTADGNAWPVAAVSEAESR
jgi:hypothetical protein